MAILTLVTLWLLMALRNIAMIGFWSENFPPHLHSQ